MITRSILAEQLREYQIRSKHDWASVSFFSSTSNLPSSSHQAELFDSKVGTNLLDIILTKLTAEDLKGITDAVSINEVAGARIHAGIELYSWRPNTHWNPSLCWLKFYIYEERKRHVPEEHRTSIMMRLSCGALAGLFGQTFTYPLDVVRRQMQVENLQPSFQGSAR